MLKTAIITGGTGAIGTALVKEFNKDFNIVFTYLESKSKADMLSKKYGATGFCCDVSDRKSVEMVISECPNCELLINNAGISQQKLFTDITELEWHKMINVHLTGAFNFSQGVLPGMINRKCGCIINISSIWGVIGASCETHYSAAKAGLIGLTKALAKEVGPSGVRVNAIAPGVIESEMNSCFSPEEMRQITDSVSLYRMGCPDDVSEAARYLLGAEYVTGQVLNVDGGFY
ncbi:MAG: SDR family oxidoreductase [Eubacterium sp.]|jgi:3-oxoacyl-[acyl-carrier protein] reductase|nr:SDR family oxidoreductase [Eubacterium sp.]